MFWALICKSDKIPSSTDDVYIGILFERSIWDLYCNHHLQEGIRIVTMWDSYPNITDFPNETVMSTIVIRLF